MADDVMSLRLDPDLMQQIDLATKVLDQTKSDFFRDAIRGHLTRIRAETGFQEALEQHLDQYRRLLAPPIEELRRDG
jgi:predicted transcriptional regulator